MPRQTNQFKVNKAAVIDQLAIFTLTDNKETVAVLHNFCHALGIDVTPNEVANKSEQFKAVAKALNK